MTVQTIDPAFSNVETWEMTTESTVWVWVREARTGNWDKRRVGGNAGGSKRLRITTDERRYNEEQVIDEMKHTNPFKDGTMRLIDRGAIELEDVDTRYHMTNADLLELLSVRDDDGFREAVESIGSELIIRRLYSLAESEGTVAQLALVKEVINDRYRVGGTQRTVQEMLDEEKNRGASLTLS